MANFKYDVRVQELKEIHEIPGAWKNEDFLDLLHHLEYDDADAVPAEELKEMASLALSDLTAEEAAVNVLELRLKEQLNKGQRQNLASEYRTIVFGRNTQTSNYTKTYSMLDACYTGHFQSSFQHRILCELL